MNFIQPAIDPVIFSIGIIDIRWYSLAYIIGILFGVSLIKRLNKFKGNLIPNKVIDSFLIWAVIGIIVGGAISLASMYFVLVADIAEAKELPKFPVSDKEIEFKDKLIRSQIDLTQQQVENIQEDVREIKETVEKIEERIYELKR